jgi:hypothetical protein
MSFGCACPVARVDPIAAQRPDGHNALAVVNLDPPARQSVSVVQFD